MAVRQLWKERSRVRALQMDNLRGLLVGIRRMDSPECTGKGVMWSEEGSAMWRGIRSL